MEVIKKQDQIDIKAGNMTFGQRIDLGKILVSKKSELEKFESIFHCLHGFTPGPEQYSNLLDYLREIVAGVVFWSQAENLMKYEPQPKEKRKLESIVESIVDPLIYNINDPLGETINALARKYNVEPADVLNWKYKKVFQILHDDWENYNNEIYYSTNN